MPSLKKPSNVHPSNFVGEQNFVWGLLRNYIRGINHLSPRNDGIRFNKRAHRGDRLYGVAHLSRDARPLRATKRGDKRAKTAKEKEKKMTKKNEGSGTRYSKSTIKKWLSGWPAKMASHLLCLHYEYRRWRTWRTTVEDRAELVAKRRCSPAVDAICKAGLERWTQGNLTLETGLQGWFRIRR